MAGRNWLSDANTSTIIQINRHVSQVVEASADIRGVGGSNPPMPILYYAFNRRRNANSN